MAIHADGNLTIADGIFISANGGNGRADGIYDHGGGGSGGAIRLVAKNIFNKGLVSVEGGNRGASGGRIVMAASGIIDRGVVLVGDGSFQEIRPPKISLPRKLHLSYLKVNDLQFRQTVLTRPQNLRAYWPMDEGSGVVTSDVVAGYNGALVGDATWQSGRFGKSIRFDGTTGFVSTMLTGEDLGIDGKKSRTISFWTYVEDGNPRSEPGFYGYGERACPGENRYWAIRNIKDGGYTQFLSQHWCWDPRVYHNNDLRNRWSHFAHLFNGSQVMVYVDGSLVANWTRGEISTGNADSLQFGRWRNDGNAYFQGSLDDFRVYDAALGGNDILQIFEGKDISEKVIEHQFNITATENPTRFEVEGLPAGLILNELTGEVTGLPNEVGVFDLNISAFNSAGRGIEQIQVIVNKTAPVTYSVSPRFVTSSSAEMSANIASNGGESLTMSLFWGSTDGGINESIDSNDSSLWDYRVDLNGSYSTGTVSHLVDGLDMNGTYFYRWMASNSVNPNAWSEASDTGMLAWWSFDEIDQTFSMDRVGNRKASFVGISESDRVFGRNGNGLRFGGAGEHLVCRNFKGIPADKPRSLSIWVNTSENEGSILSWGDNGNGNLWELEIIDGKFGLRVGGGRLEGIQSVNDGSWHQLAVVFPSAAQVLNDVILFVDGDVYSRNIYGNPTINTGEDFDMLIGTNSGGNNFTGIIDELRIYERDLSQNEIKSIFLDGTMVFSTLSVASPPIVELTEVEAQANSSVVIHGELVSVDLTNPTVRIYYGLQDGGFSASDWNNSFVEVNGGSEVGIGDFNATITGLTPGERYHFRAFAESDDGFDWSSGTPAIRNQLIGYWRMDESNGSYVADSIAPFNDASLVGFDPLDNRSQGVMGKSISFNGFSTLLDLDANGTGFLEKSFDGRSVSMWLKTDGGFYTGPRVVGHSSIVGYYPFDDQSGTDVPDLSASELTGKLVNGANLQTGNNGQAVHLDGNNDRVSIPTNGPMASLNQKSHTISMWINPGIESSGTYTEGRLFAHGFLRSIDNTYYTNIESMLGLTPSGSNFLTNGPGGRGLDFNNDSDYRNAGIGINRNDQYLSLFNGVFYAPQTGSYAWEIRGNDDRGTIWLDLDQDGVFEQSGDKGNEQLLYQPNCCGTQSTLIDLQTGYYRIAIAHGEGGGGSNQEAYFSTPGGGPTSLSIIKPSDYPTLFLTHNEKTVMSRGPLRLVLDGNNNLVYTHADQLGSAKVSSNLGLSSNNWSHLALSIDYNSSKLSLYLNGQKRGETDVTSGSQLEISSSVPWNIGGSSAIWQDHFNGKVDDLRFYNSSLSESEILEIYNDDLTNVELAANKKQIIYDEGTDESGLSIAIDQDGYVVARLVEGGSMSTLSSESPIRDNQWHHLVVTFGDLPKIMKMYLDDSLQGNPVVHSSSFISTHLEKPSLGGLTGTSSFPSYGSFLGNVDELRIYDRGLTNVEVSEVYNGDYTNNGSLDFLAIRKASVFAVSAVDVMPTQATMRVDVESIGGEVQVVDESLDLSFKTSTFDTMQAWFSSYNLSTEVQNGGQISFWTDLSGSGKHFENSSGDPSVKHDGIKGKPVIALDGDDLLWTSADFDFLTESGYTILTLARYSGSKINRVISSRNRNYLLAFKMDSLVVGMQKDGFQQQDLPIRIGIFM